MLIGRLSSWIDATRVARSPGRYGCQGRHSGQEAVPARIL